jgi:hypothetical protein
MLGFDLTEGFGAQVVPEPMSQLGAYELDLLKFCYFGWLNSVSLGMSFWGQQFWLPEE